MPESWWDRFGQSLIKLGVSFMTQRNQRTLAFALFLGHQFRQECPEDHEAIVSGAAVPLTGKPEPRVHLH